MFSARNKRKAEKEVPEWRRQLEEAEEAGSIPAIEPDAAGGRPVLRDSPEPPRKPAPARAPAAPPPPGARKVEAQQKEEDDDDDDDDVDLSAYHLGDDGAAADPHAHAGMSSAAAAAAGGRVVVSNLAHDTSTGNARLRRLLSLVRILFVVAKGSPSHPGIAKGTDPTCAVKSAFNNLSPRPVLHCPASCHTGWGRPAVPL
jgi:hypothetical protein